MPTTLTVMMCKRLPGDEVEEQLLASVYDDKVLACDFFESHIQKFLQYDFVLDVQHFVGEPTDEELLTEVTMRREVDEAFASLTMHTFPDPSPDE